MSDEPRGGIARIVDPKKLIGKLEQMRREKPFRYLGRRVLQAMAESASANLVLGQRTAPGRYLAVRLVETPALKEEWEQQFAESRAAILQELERESAARDLKPRSRLELDLVVLTDAEADRGEADRVLHSVLDRDEADAAFRELREEREIVLPRRVRTLVLESVPPEAQVYLDHRPLGVTPCRVDDVAEGEHLLTFSRPGYLLREETLRIEPGRPGHKLTHRVELEPEPEMGVLEVRTFPPRAQVTIGGETRDSPVRWRLPAGPVDLRVELEDFAPVDARVTLPGTADDRPYPVQIRLEYVGAGKDEVVGRLVVYRPGGAAPKPRAGQRPVAAAEPNRISSFFQDTDPEVTQEWDLPPIAQVVEEPDEVLGERPLRRGVLLIGREDPGGGLTPDVKLFDPENSVSRGCHAWLWVYADTSTGATYNTFLVGNNSPAGIRVDGALVMESRRLSDDSVIEVGNFRMRLVKETPEPRVEFGF